MAISIQGANSLFYANNALETKFTEEREEQLRQLLDGIVYKQSDIQKKVKKLINNNVEVKRCFFYGRVSTKSNEQMTSILGQHNIAEDFEQEYLNSGFVIIEEVFERESATTCRKRKKFMKLVERCKAGEADAIVVKSVDRMFRNVEDTIAIMNELKAVNVALIFYYDKLNSLNEEDRNAIIERANDAEHYSNKLSVNVKRGKQRNIRNGKGRAPAYIFGYDKPIVNDSSVIYINETEAEIVREIFNRFVYNNESMAGIANSLRVRGIKSKLNKEMSSVAIRRMLKNSDYTGRWRANTKTRNSIREVYKDTDDSELVFIMRPDLRIISDEVYELAQKRMSINSEKHKSRVVPKATVFKSLIQCDCCGKNFKQVNNGVDPRTGEINHYYKCTVYRTPARHAIVTQCTNSTSLKKEELVETLRVYFMEILRNKKDIKERAISIVSNLLKSVQEDESNSSLVEDIKKTEELYKRELKLVREGLVDDTGELKKIKKRLDEIKEQYAMQKRVSHTDYDINKIVDDLISNIEDLVADGFDCYYTDGYKFNNLFENIRCTEDGRLIITFKCDSSYLTKAFRYSGLNSDSSSDNFICPSCNTDRDGCYEKYICKFRDLLDKDFDTELFTDVQLDSIVDSLSIPLNEYFDNNIMYDYMQNFRYRNRSIKYRYSPRVRGLGKDIIDTVILKL